MLIPIKMMYRCEKKRGEVEMTKKCKTETKLDFVKFEHDERQDK